MCAQGLQANKNQVKDIDALDYIREKKLFVVKVTHVESIVCSLFVLPVTLFACWLFLVWTDADHNACQKR